MSSKMMIAAMLAAAGLALPTMAQDSVSPTPGLASTDAVTAWDASETLNTFVVDLQDITTSWGNTFGIAPIFKSSRAGFTGPSNFPNVNISHNVVSNMTVQRTAPFATYDLWTAPGGGVAPVNTPGAPTAVSGQTFQLAAAFQEFGFTDGGVGNEFEWNAIVGGTINYTAADPKRLYVARAQYAASGRSNTEELSQFGVGAVDASGNAYFRADGNSVPNTFPSRLQTNNIFRVRLLPDGPLAGRAPSTLNVIDNNADNASSLADNGALDWVVKRSSVTFSVPNAIPRERGLGVSRAIFAGVNFNNAYVFESAPLLTSSTTAQLGAAAGQRSPSSFSQAAFFPGSVGTKGVVLSNDVADALSVWGVDANGGFTAARELPLPAAIADTDAASPYSIALDLVQIEEDPNDTFDSFDHYRGTTAFRGGPAVGVGSDAAGRLLTTGVVYLRRPSPFTGSPDLQNWAFNGISVARLATPEAAPEWTWAAYVLPNPEFNPFDPNPNNRNPVRGKPFFNAEGEMLGELRPFFEIGAGSPAFGPSMSAGAVDAAGNVWFVGVYDRYTETGDLRGNATSGLFRAVYDPAAFSYRLELVLNNGAEIRGRNSDRDFKIIFLGLTNNNGGPSSDGLFASAVNQSTWAGASVASLPTSDPRTLGGLVLKASVIYDVNGDGEFQSLTGGAGDPNGPDQNYQVLLFLGGAASSGGPISDCNQNGVDDAVEIAGNPALDCFDRSAVNITGGPDGSLDACQCQANWNRDDAVNSGDISAFLTSWISSVQNADTNGDFDCSGVTNSGDISSFLTTWIAGVQGTIPHADCP